MAYWIRLTCTVTVLALAGRTAIVSSARSIPYNDARAIIDVLREDLVPSDLRTGKPADRAAQWPDWISRRDQAIRARLERGDRDSVVNFLIFGSTFTKRPRPSGDDLAALIEPPGRISALLAARLDDLVRAVATPRSNERLQIAKDLLERAGIDPTTVAGRRQARDYFVEGLKLGQREAGSYAREMSSAGGSGQLAAIVAGTAFRDRGLSSDTSIVVNAALDQAFSAIGAQGLLRGSAVRRVGVIGPGLDFTDKHDGHDFYPLQTIQPFAVIDSLVQHGLANAEALRLMTLDVSPRIVQHIDAARRGAERGQGYLVNLPRNRDLPWSRELSTYWERFGAQIGGRAVGAKAPPSVGNVVVRSVRVRPAIVRVVEPQDLNIVAERLDLLPDERFDIIVATDVLVYYGMFEQSLALANIASMLRPGGLLVTNTPLFELPAIPLEAVGAIEVVHMTMPIVGEIRDRVTWYRRR